MNDEREIERDAVAFDGTSIAAFAVFLLLFGVLCFHVWAYTVDDAFIVARYARRLLHGQGYTFSDGPATDGVTGPLWLLPALAGQLLGFEVAVQKLLSCLGVALGAALLFFSLDDTRARAFFLAFCLVQSNLVVWGVAGLDTGLATALASYLWLCASTSARPTNVPFRPHTFLACAALLSTLRPESLPFAVCACAMVVRTDGWSRILRWAAVPVGAFLLLCLIRLASFGHALPLSYYAKRGSLDLIYVLFGLFIATGILPLAIAAWHARERGQSEVLSGLLLATVWTLSIAWAGGDWMPGFRLLVPIIPGLGWLIAKTFPSAKLSLRVSLGMFLLLPALDTFVQLPRAVEAGQRRVEQGSALVRAVQESAQSGTVALVDIGLVGLRSGLDVLDLGGVTDPRVGKAPGGYLAKQVDIGLLESVRPALIVLHSASPITLGEHTSWPPLFGYPIENWLYTQPWTRANYQPVQVVHYAPGYDYLLLKRLSAADAKISASSP